MVPAADALLTLRLKLDQAEAGRLSPFACLSHTARRRRAEEAIDKGHRQNFALDADRILHSLAYTRYIDKTQVFSLMDNDQITHRVLHVQLVSKIARTIGRVLALNEDLIEAIALGHDIGHPPFGHDGETYLSAKCREHGLGPFLHNLQSVRFLDRLEKGGRGLNLSLQVLDGVLCHDGEVHSDGLAPRPRRDFAELEAQVAGKKADPRLALIPMTMEGCVVRITDTVAYIGRDLEDAILVGVIERRAIPRDIAAELGETNGTIVYRLVEDLLLHSAGRAQVGFSPAKSQALKTLKEFNLRRIYLDERIKREHAKIERGFDLLFDRYLEDLEEGRRDSAIFTDFLAQMDARYQEEEPPPAKVADFMAGMTDAYFLRQLSQLVSPDAMPRRMGSKVQN